MLIIDLLLEDIHGELRDRVVLVTGGTGFLGQVLIEKLFRSVQIKHLYLLIRNKKGLSPQERLDTIFKGPVRSIFKTAIKFPSS
jgi:fatty acyl-CoA reductase